MSLNPYKNNRVNDLWTWKARGLVRECHPRIPSRPTVRVRNPFSLVNEDMSSPIKFFQTRFKSYRGNSNPDYHIIHYRNVMVLYNNNST